MSSPTLALLRKDRLWLVSALIGGSVGAANAFHQIGFRDAFVVPSGDAAELVALLGSVGAVLLAVCAALWDELRGTRDVLRHRPVTAGQFFWTRQLAALAVIATWMVAGVATVWLIDFLSPWGLGGEGADLTRFLPWGTLAVGFALDYALVTLALSVPTHWVNRVWLAGLLLFTRYALQSVLGSADPSLPILFGLSLAGTVVSLVVAARCQRSGWDADHPLNAQTLGALAVLLLGAASLCGATAAGGWQKIAHGALENARMRMGVIEGPRLALLAHPQHDDTWEVVTAEGVGTGERVGQYRLFVPNVKSPDFEAGLVPALFPRFAMYQHFYPSQTDERRGERVVSELRVGNVLSRRVADRVTRRVWITDAELRVFEESELGRTVWRLPLPSGFLAPAWPWIELRQGEDKPLFLRGENGGGPWLVTTETPPRLLLQPLPDSDRFVETTGWMDEAGHSLRVVQGAEHRWRYVDGAWTRIEDSLASAEQPRATFTVLDADPLHPEAELALTGGTTLRHLYELVSPRETICAGFAILASILRPAPFALWSARTDYATVAETKPDEALLLLDPLLGAGRQWLLGMNLSFTALWMAFTFRDLRRRGSSLRRSAGWSLGVFIGGIFAGPILLALEPKRAWQRPEKRSAPRMLLRETSPVPATMG
jgi:hypothetical protein